VRVAARDHEGPLWQQMRVSKLQGSVVSQLNCEHRVPGLHLFAHPARLKCKGLGIAGLQPQTSERRRKLTAHHAVAENR
jgi:hypothetical protein